MTAKLTDHLRFYIFDHDLLSDDFLAWAELPISQFLQQPYLASDIPLKYVHEFMFLLCFNWKIYLWIPSTSLISFSFNIFELLFILYLIFEID